MKRLSKLTLNLTLALALVAFFSNYSFAQDTGDDAVTHGAGFVDENGDGFLTTTLPMQTATESPTVWMKTM